MKENKGLFSACCLISLAWLYTAYDADHDNSLFAMLLGLGGIVSLLGLVVLAVYRVIKRAYLPWQKRLMPLCILLIPFIASASYGFAAKLFNAPDWLLVERYDFTGSDNLLFKKNGEYQYWRDGPLGRSTIVRGQYERRDSLLIIQTNSDATMSAVARIAIRPYQPDKQISRLVALDSAGAALAIFRVKRRTK